MKYLVLLSAMPSLLFCMQPREEQCVQTLERRVEALDRKIKFAQCSLVSVYAFSGFVAHAMSQSPDSQPAVTEQYIEDSLELTRGMIGIYRNLKSKRDAYETVLDDIKSRTEQQ